MKSSNLALRLDDDEAPLERMATKDDLPAAPEPAAPADRRPRRSLVRPSADETRSNGATTLRASRSRSPARMPS